MQPKQHLEASQYFLDAAAILEAIDFYMAAAEMIWGAVVQALEAIGHIRAGNARGFLSSNGRRRLAESINPEGLTMYYLVQNGLHGHFYKGHLSPVEYVDSMQKGRDYATELLAIALSSAGQ